MILSGIAQRLPRLWYRRRLAVALLPLIPISWLFSLIVGLRYRMFRCRVLRSYRLRVPVVIVGNLTVGGSGKTPLVLWLVERLREQGRRPGIISRGYGGVAAVQAVASESSTFAVGDEPLLLARRSGVPVFVGRDRVGAGQALLAAHPECDVIISDDGLQHYRLQRDAEIVVFDGRGAGNGQLLPAGPLREPLLRLAKSTAMVWNSVHVSHHQVVRSATRLPQFAMTLLGQRFYALADATKTCSAEDLRTKRLYALAGIGDPSRFFTQLEVLGLVFEAHPFSDHHRYSAADLSFADDGVLLMTEKDAVKCAALTTCETWVLPVNAHISKATDGSSLLDTILEKINGCTLA